jgi:phosphorylcholine metabolism protein LicD
MVGLRRFYSIGLSYLNFIARKNIGRQAYGAYESDFKSRLYQFDINTQIFSKYQHAARKKKLITDIMVIDYMQYKDVVTTCMFLYSDELRSN